MIISSLPLPTFLLHFTELIHTYTSIRSIVTIVLKNQNEDKGTCRV